ncbi:hypothetical protein ACTXT7_004803 [Hymenolepis weldensis]
MSEIPSHLKGLLRFCIEAGSEPSGGIEPMDPERAKWLREALEHATVDVVEEMKRRIGKVIENLYSKFSADKKGETVECLEDLIDFTEDINLADVFLKIGGLKLLKELLEKPFEDYLSYAGMLLSNVMQNHPEAQSIAIDAGLLDTTLDLLPKQEDPGDLGGLLSGISSLIRASKKSIEKFLQLNGFETIFQVLEKIKPEEEYSRFIEKAAFFLYCISQEFSAKQRVVLRSSDITERIAGLIMKFKVPREFLVRALTFFLVGRISILDDPLADPNPPAPVTLTLNAEMSDKLRKWAESEVVQKQLDPDARKSLLKALE